MISPLVAAVLVLASPLSTRDATFSILQMNDVYEITPVSGEGGMSRVATAFKRLQRREPNSFVVVAGDFFSPSALGTARVNGERLGGQQMVAVMNLLPVSFATFGNHEFDLNFDGFRKRMAESKFKWVSSNVLDAQGKPFPGVHPSFVETIETKGGSLRVGLLGVTIPSNPKEYVRYSDVLDSATRQVKELRPQVDVLIAITHLAHEDDIKLARALPEIDMILGGHEHERHRIEIGSLPGIYKADANARTVFIHDFAFSRSTRKLKTTSKLLPLTAEVPEDKAVKQEVERWVKVAFDAFRKEGFEPSAKVANLTEALDGSEPSVRNRSTNLTRIIASAMLATAPSADLAIFNGGSIRIDDVIPPGPITEYDVIRILPFGGKVWSITMKGSLLKQVLDQGLANVGNGGYLHKVGVSMEPDGAWRVGATLLAPETTYKVVINDFLLTGNEQNLPYLKRDNPDIKVIEEHEDIRTLVIAQLRKAFPSPGS